jgi:hypothetical protein
MTIKSTGVNKGEINIAGFSAYRRTIIAKYSFADADTTPKGSPNRLTWSELIFQRYEELAGVNVNQLESVVRSSVSNADTIRTLTQDFANMGQPFATNGAPVVFNANTATGTAEKAAFDAIPCTDNGRRRQLDARGSPCRPW